MPSTTIRQRRDAKWVLAAPTLADFYDAVSAEPFREQPIAAVGTAFLVEQDTIATALHVARRITRGETLRIVFGYEVRDGRTRTVFEVDDVYEGKEVEWCDSRADMALVRLDRAVARRQPLRLRLESPVQIGEPIYVIGYPAGLPAKYAGNAHVSPNVSPNDSADVSPNVSANVSPGVSPSKDSGYFCANLDVMICNSGSPVFSEREHDVVGIATRGPIGFVTYHNQRLSDLTHEKDDDVMISRITNMRPQPSVAGVNGRE